MTIFQILALLFAIFMVYWVFSSYKRQNLKRTEMLIWIMVWIGFIVLAIFPNLLLGIVGVLDFARVFDLLVVIAFMATSTMVFYLYLRVKKNEKKLEDLVRELAFKKVDRSEK